jgi:hypothetical protein
LGYLTLEDGTNSFFPKRRSLPTSPSSTFFATPIELSVKAFVCDMHLCVCLIVVTHLLRIESGVTNHDVSVDGDCEDGEE